LESLTRADKGLARGRYYIQVGSFQGKNNATRLIKTLKARGLAQSRVQDAVVRGVRFWRVLAGEFHGLSAAEKARAGMADEFPSCFILAD
ncbi:MAG: SPOR domain-containing protein, partial [Thermodesulfobacteriota bacterium]|nr:SPOR domain-containing protein [Thermodesulfobacteriota bacterium]